MSVVRIKRHRDRFTVLSTATLRTASLSLKARGLWALCMSYPDDWEFRSGHLQAQSAHDGRGAVRSALKELEAAGLAALETLRGDGGRVRGKRWTIYEEARLNPSHVTPDDAVAPADEPEPGRSVGDPPEDADRRADEPTDGSGDDREARPTAEAPRRKNQRHEAPMPGKNEQHASAPSAPPARPPTALRLVGGVAAGEGRNAEDARGEDTSAEVEALLVRRGVEAPVAARLAVEHGAEAVRRAVALYDARRRGPTPPSGPGWLVAALRRGFACQASASAPLLAHGEMLRWCEANGGLHRTAEFEPVRRPGEPVLFRRRTDGGAPPPPPPADRASVQPE